jgi:hypothetical protein
MNQVSYDTNLSQNCNRRTSKLTHGIWQLNKNDEYENEEYMIGTTHTERLILRETEKKNIWNRMNTCEIYEGHPHMLTCQIEKRNCKTK